MISAACYDCVPLTRFEIKVRQTGFKSVIRLFILANFRLITITPPFLIRGEEMVGRRSPLLPFQPLPHPPYHCMATPKSRTDV